MPSRCNASLSWTLTPRPPPSLFLSLNRVTPWRNQRERGREWTLSQFNFSLTHVLHWVFKSALRAAKARIYTHLVPFITSYRWNQVNIYFLSKDKQRKYCLSALFFIQRMAKSKTVSKQITQEQKLFQITHRHIIWFTSQLMLLNGRLRAHCARVEAPSHCAQTDRSLVERSEHTAGLIHVNTAVNHWS